jgi:hypothetical protein
MRTTSGQRNNVVTRLIRTGAVRASVRVEVEDELPLRLSERLGHDEPLTRTTALHTFNVFSAPSRILRTFAIGRPMFVGVKSPTIPLVIRVLRHPFSTVCSPAFNTPPAFVLM